jgi:MerR family transcriptional regulator, thiopeptide resistance regulator
MSTADSYAKEAAERWPEEYAASNLKLKSMSNEDQQKLFKVGIDNIKDIADAFLLQSKVDSKEVQDLVKLHYNWVSVFWVPSKDAYIGLGQMYVDDPRFTQNYDKHAPGCAEFMAKAMKIYAEQNLSN